MADTNFLGFNNFIWFTGVVEDRTDPFFLGRVRVRCVGIHTQDKQVLPTKDLPWSQVILPVTSPGISGLGHSPSFLVEGSWVFGYFRDGASCQEPCVIGSLPGVPSELGDVEKGFYDPISRLDENGEPTGISVYPREKSESDVNRLARIDFTHLALQNRIHTVKTGIATADFNATTNASGGEITASDGDTWDQPAPAYAAVYPFNHVYESESGHIYEVDDTVGAERIYFAHRKGTGYEIDKEGTINIYNKKEKYELTSGKYCHAIEGDSDITIDGRHKIYINKKGESNNNYDIQIGPNANINIQVDKGNINLVTVDGDINMNVGGNYNLKVKGDYTSDIWGSKKETIEGSKTSNTTMSVFHRGSTIDLN